MMSSLWQAGSILIVLGLSSVVLAAPVPKGPDAKAVVKDFFNRIEKGTGADSAPLFLPPALEVIKEFGPYLERGTASQQSDAVRMISVLGRRSGEKEVRSHAVKLLLTYATTDGKPQVRQALGDLLPFSKADYPKDAAAQIEKLVRVADPHQEALLLAGVVEVTSVKDVLKKLADTPEGKTPFLNPGWSANLALARLGDAEAVRHCIQAIEAEADIVQRARHFPELVFIRQEPAITALTKYLMSEERLPSVRRNTPGSKLALYALDVLIDGVEGVPIKSEKGPSYTSEQLDRARKWVKDQKELKFKR